MNMSSRLLDGLPDDVTVEEILPRIPWYVRPVCRAASKLWKATIDAAAEDPEIQRFTRNFQLPQLTGSTAIATSEEERGRPLLLINSDIQGIRKLPPVNLFPGSPRFVFWRGKLYVWTLVGHKCWSGDRDRMFKLDIGAGRWKWESFQADRISNWFDAVFHDGKIYASWKARHSFTGLPATVRLDVQVYDMKTDSCYNTHQWDGVDESIGASWDGVDDSGKLAGLAWNWDLLTYEGGLWKPHLVIPPEDWPTDAKFVRGDCFAPALKQGFSIMLLGRNYTSNQDYIKWYNTHSSGNWSVIEDPQSSLAGGLKLKKMEVVDGRLCALCRDESKKWIIMHGVIETMRSEVVWEVFQELTSDKILYWTVMKTTGGTEM